MKIKAWLVPTLVNPAVLGQQARGELETFLTESEREEYDLRHSSSAQLLREGLQGFEVTEAEFRQLFRLRQAFDEQIRNITETGESDLLTQWQQFQESAGQVLGAERSELFQRAQNPG